MPGPQVAVVGFRVRGQQQQAGADRLGRGRCREAVGDRRRRPPGRPRAPRSPARRRRGSGGAARAAPRGSSQPWNVARSAAPSPARGVVRPDDVQVHRLAGQLPRALRAPPRGPCAASRRLRTAAPAGAPRSRAVPARRTPCRGSRVDLRHAGQVLEHRRRPREHLVRRRRPGAWPPRSRLRGHEPAARVQARVRPDALVAASTPERSSPSIGSGSPSRSLRRPSTPVHEVEEHAVHVRHARATARAAGTARAAARARGTGRASRTSRRTRVSGRASCSASASA